MMKNKIKPFEILITEIFKFDDGIIVFIGEITGGGNIITPCKARLSVQGNESIIVNLEGERMLGDKIPRNYRVVYTRDTLDLDNNIVKNTECKLIYPI